MLPVPGSRYANTVAEDKQLRNPLCRSPCYVSPRACPRQRARRRPRCRAASTSRTLSERPARSNSVTLIQLASSVDHQRSPAASRMALEQPRGIVPASARAGSSPPRGAQRLGGEHLRIVEVDQRGAPSASSSCASASGGPCGRAARAAGHRCRGTARAPRRSPPTGSRRRTGSRSGPDRHGGRCPGTGAGTRAPRPAPRAAPTGPRAGPARGSREAAGPLGRDRVEQLARLAAPDQVERPAVAEARVEPDQPALGGGDG